MKLKDLNNPNTWTSVILGAIVVFPWTIVVIVLTLLLSK